LNSIAIRIIDMLYKLLALAAWENSQISLKWNNDAYFMAPAVYVYLTQFISNSKYMLQQLWAIDFVCVQIYSVLDQIFLIFYVF